MAPTPLVVNKLAGKKVVVIGGSSGIGFAVASALVEEGASVVISSSSTEKVAAAVARLGDVNTQYNADPARVAGHTVNLKGPGAEASLEGFFAKAGAVDHIVHTAGDALAIVPLQQVTYEGIIDAGQVRFISAILTAKVGARHLAKGGSMTFTSGAIAVKPIENWVAVAGFMSGLYGLTRQLAYDLAPQHFRVNLVSPGGVKTELWDGMSDSARENLYQYWASTNLTRHAAEQHEIAQPYLYLMKDTNM
jgi:NAD(P)-dependent dehydrogenase (short-subunit alcohol dehydrogenase family)